MYQASDGLVVARGGVDSIGNFHVNFQAGSAEALFRIQFIKESDPVSTIIIGGKEENHAFFIAKQGDRIAYSQPQSDRVVSQENIRNGASNDELINLLRLAKSDTLPRDSVKEGLIRLSKKSRSEVIALLSVHLMFGLNSSQKARVAGILSRLDQSNPYGERIFKEYAKDRFWIFFFIFLSIGTAMGIPLSLKYYRNRLMSKSLQTLSLRELSVIRLLMEGRTNKEIAAMLSIELSTVKTHVNNSYSKLKVTDRRGLMKYQKFVNQITG